MTEYYRYSHKEGLFSSEFRNPTTGLAYEYIVP